MSSFSTMKLVAWIFFICTETSTSRIVRRELTDQRIEIDSDLNEEFPSVLPVFLKSPNRIVKLNLTKQYLDFNIPVYTRQKDGSTILLDTPPITNAAFYEDPSYEASVTVHCEENDPLSSSRDACNAKLMSGSFDLDGHRHVIEPKKRIFKRFVMYLDQNSQEKFAERHQVFKIYSQNQSCGVKDHDHPHFNSTINSHINSHINSGNERPKRNKVRNTIEVMAVFTHRIPISQEEIKSRKLYYLNVFANVNRHYNNIIMKDMSFGVNLIGFILEPHDTPIYVFPDPKNRTGHLDYGKTMLALIKLKETHPCDHITLFSKYNLDPNSGVMGYARTDAMCHSFSVSLIRNQGHFEEVFTLTHEIGHSLGCNHDGNENNCPLSDGVAMGDTYILRPTIQESSNHYRFSNCSIKSIKRYMSSLKPQNCMVSAIKKPMVPQIPAGQLYPVWEQCRVMSEETIGICPWCIFGYCVYDDMAPMADESCLHGDHRVQKVRVRLLNGTHYQPKNCTELIKLTPGFCKNSTHRKKSCDTCFQLAHPGNRMTFPLPSTLPISTLSSSSVAPVQSTLHTSDHAPELKSHFFPVALAVLHLFLFGRYFVS